MKKFRGGFWSAMAALAVLVSASNAGRAADADPDVFVDRSHDWTGLYAGLGLEGGAGGVDIRSVGPKNKFDIKDKTYSLTGIAGYNAMVGNFVFGLEGTLGSGPVNKKRDVTGFGTVKAKSNWEATMALRAGYAFDNLLIYGTGGLALADFELSSSLGGKKDKTLVGGVIGIGAEYAVSDDWAVRAEALATGYSTKVLLAGSKQKVDLGSSVVRVAITHKF